MDIKPYKCYPSPFADWLFNDGYYSKENKARRMADYIAEKKRKISDERKLEIKKGDDFLISMLVVFLIIATTMIVIDQVMVEFVEFDEYQIELIATNYIKDCFECPSTARFSNVSISLEEKLFNGYVVRGHVDYVDILDVAISMEFWIFLSCCESGYGYYCYPILSRIY